MTTGMATNLNNPPLQQASLSQINSILSNAQFQRHDGQRYVLIEFEEIPVSEVVHVIYAKRPYIYFSGDNDLSLYFDSCKKFTLLLQQDLVEKPRSSVQKIVDMCSCYFPIPCCWCTSACKENVIIEDSRLTLDWVHRWRIVD